METVKIDKQAIHDLLRLKEEFDAVIESLELMSDREFMDSYQKAREEIDKRDFDEWEKL